MTLPTSEIQVEYKVADDDGYFLIRGGDVPGLTDLFYVDRTETLQEGMKRGVLKQDPRQAPGLQDIRATFTTEDGRVIEIAPITMIEPAEFITLEPQPPVRLSFTCSAKITPPLIVGGKQWCEMVYGPDRRVVGRKIRQARRRMRRMMEGCL